MWRASNVWGGPEGRVCGSGDGWDMRCCHGSGDSACDAPAGAAGRISFKHPQLESQRWLDAQRRACRTLHRAANPGSAPEWSGVASRSYHRGDWGAFIGPDDAAALRRRRNHSSRNAGGLGGSGSILPPACGLGGGGAAGASAAGAADGAGGGLPGGGYPAARAGFFSGGDRSGVRAGGAGPPFGDRQHHWHQQWHQQWHQHWHRCWQHHWQWYWHRHRHCAGTPERTLRPGRDCAGVFDRTHNQPGCPALLRIDPARDLSGGCGGCSSPFPGPRPACAGGRWWAAGFDGPCTGAVSSSRAPHPVGAVWSGCGQSVRRCTGIRRGKSGKGFPRQRPGGAGKGTSGGVPSKAGGTTDRSSAGPAPCADAQKQAGTTGRILRGGTGWR